MARLRFDNIGDSTGEVSPISFADGSTSSGSWTSNPNIPSISGNDYIAIIVQSLSGQEIVYLSDYTNADLSGSFLRAQEGTVGVAHANEPWIHGPTAVDFLPTILLTHTGEPVTDDGTFIAGQIAVDTDGVEYVCTAGGVPGTWETSVSPGFGLTVILTHTGPPTSDDGTFVAGAEAIDTGNIPYVCTVGGTPGTWVEAAPGTTFVSGFIDGDVNFSGEDLDILFYTSPSLAVGTYLLIAQLGFQLPDSTGTLRSLWSTGTAAGNIGNGGGGVADFTVTADNIGGGGTITNICIGTLTEAGTLTVIGANYCADSGYLDDELTTISIVRIS